MSVVYLIHLHQPLPRGTNTRGHTCYSSHYCGTARDLVKRLTHHKHGSGARLLQVCRERGIEWSLVRV